MTITAIPAPNASAMKITTSHSSPLVLAISRPPPSRRPPPVSRAVSFGASMSVISVLLVCWLVRSWVPSPGWSARLRRRDRWRRGEQRLVRRDVLDPLAVTGAAGLIGVALEARPRTEVLHRRGVELHPGHVLGALAVVAGVAVVRTVDRFRVAARAYLRVLEVDGRVRLLGERLVVRPLAAMARLARGPLVACEAFEVVLERRLRVYGWEPPVLEVRGGDLAHVLGMAGDACARGDRVLFEPVADEAARHGGPIDLVGFVRVGRMADRAVRHPLVEVHRVPVQEVGQLALLEDLVEVAVAVRAAEEGLARHLDIADLVRRGRRRFRLAGSPGDGDRDEREPQGDQRHQHHQYPGDRPPRLRLLHHGSSPWRPSRYSASERSSASDSWQPGIPLSRAVP